MKSYKQNLKRRLLTALGLLDDQLAHDENIEFDIEIARCSSRCLSDRELLVFFHLFRCEDSYEATRDKVNRDSDKAYPLNTIVKYGRRAVDRFAVHIHKDKRLSAWIRRNQERMDRDAAN